MSWGKRLKNVVVFTCLLALSISGCAGRKTEQTAEAAADTQTEGEKDKIQIGLTVDSFVIERWIRDRNVFVATARLMCRTQVQMPRNRSVRSITS